MDGLQNIGCIDIEVQGLTVLAYIDFQEAHSYITMALLGSLKYQKNDAKYGEALIPVNGAYQLTKGFIKECKFTLQNKKLKYPLYIVPENKKFIMLGRDWLEEVQAKITGKGTDKYLRIFYQEGKRFKSLQTPLYNLMEERLLISNNNNLELFTTESICSNSVNETDKTTENETMLIDLSEEMSTEVASSPTLSISKDVLDLDEIWFYRDSEEFEKNTCEFSEDVINAHVDPCNIKAENVNPIWPIESCSDDIIEQTEDDFQQRIQQWMQQIQEYCETKSSSNQENHLSRNNEILQINDPNEEEKEIYAINTSRKSPSKKAKERVTNYKSQRGELQKKQKMKEGKCFICNEKGHRMKECKFEKEFRKQEQYCHEHKLNIWDRWKRRYQNLNINEHNLKF